MSKISYKSYKHKKLQENKNTGRNARIICASQRREKYLEELHIRRERTNAYLASLVGSNN